MKEWIRIEKRVNKKILGVLRKIGNYAPFKWGAFVLLGHLNLYTFFKSKVIEGITFFLNLGKGLAAEAKDTRIAFIHSLARMQEQKGWRGGKKIVRMILFTKMLLRLFADRFFHLIHKVGPATVAIGLVFTGLFAIALLGIHLYKSGQSSLKVEDYLTTNPRPSYYKQGERLLTIRNISIPIYSESVNSYRKLQTDVTIIPSNKYIREFFYNNTHYIHDALNTNFRPIQASFSLEEEEGKEIIAEKIKEEINILIKRLGIKGDIKFVYIHYIFAG